MVFISDVFIKIGNAGAADDSDNQDDDAEHDVSLAPIATIEQIVSEIAAKDNAIFKTMSDLELNEVG